MKPVSKEVSLSPTVKTIPNRLKRFVVGVINKAGFEWVKEKRNFAQIGSSVIDVQRNQGSNFGKDNIAQMCPAAENKGRTWMQKNGTAGSKGTLVIALILFRALALVPYFRIAPLWRSCLSERR